MDRLKDIRTALTKVVRLAIFSNIYIATGALCFALLNIGLLGLPLHLLWPLLVLITAATFFVYQLSRWAFHERIHVDYYKDGIYQWLENKRGFTIASMVISGAVIIVSALLLKARTWLAFGALGAISVSYPLGIPLPGKQKFILRNLPFAKIFFISFVWAAMAVIIPAIESDGWSGIGLRHIALFLIQALFIFIITLPFDINDADADRLTDLKTIPNVWGAQKCKQLLVLLTGIFLAALAVWLGYYRSIVPVTAGFWIAVALLMSALLYKTLQYSERAEKWQIMLWYDGSLLLYYLLYLLSNTLK